MKVIEAPSWPTFKIWKRLKHGKKHLQQGVKIGRDPPSFGSLNIYRIYTHHKKNASFHGKKVPSFLKVLFVRATLWSCQVQRFLSQPFFVAEIFTGTPGAFVDLETTHLGFFKDDYLWSSDFFGIFSKAPEGMSVLVGSVGSFGSENLIRMGLDGLVYAGVVWARGWMEENSSGPWNWKGQKAA